MRALEINHLTPITWQPNSQVQQHDKGPCRSPAAVSAAAYCNCIVVEACRAHMHVCCMYVYCIYTSCITACMHVASMPTSCMSAAPSLLHTASLSTHARQSHAFPHSSHATPLPVAHLEGRKEKLPRRQLQESNPCICNRSLQEQHQLLAKAEAATNGHSSGQGSHQHTLTQLFKVVPDRHLQNGAVHQYRTAVY